MDGDEAMIVAGVGFRRNASAEEITSLVESALGRASLAREALGRLATLVALAGVPAFGEAARRLAVEAKGIGSEETAAVAAMVCTNSPRALAAHGVGSVAEAAALGGAGPGSTLVLARVSSTAATCALAQSAEKSGPPR
jgi:cobalt-precorrin 5A hydrolase